MRKISLLNALILFAPLFFALTTVNITQAGIPEDVFYGEFGHRISVWNPDSLTFYTLEPTYIREGWAMNDIKDNANNFLPCEIKIFLNGEEIKLQRFHFYDKNGEYFPGYPEYHHWFFYQIFEPGYFKPGTYSWHVIYLSKAKVIEVYETLNVLSPP